MSPPTTSNEMDASLPPAPNGDDADTVSHTGPGPSSSQSISQSMSSPNQPTSRSVTTPQGRRRTLAPPPNIVVTPAKTNLRAKRRRADSSDDTDDSPPQRSRSKRRKLGVLEDSNGKGKAVDNGEAGTQETTSTSSSAIYPTPISAIFPPTPTTSIPPTLQQGETPVLQDAIQFLPSPLPTPKKKPPFQMLHAFMKHPELILNLARVLHPLSLVDLYAISKPFHFILNSHYTTYIKASMEYHSPQAHLIFPWRCYARSCIKDPAWRPSTRNAQVARDVPSLRWLQMVTYRDECVRDILISLWKYGLLLPHGIEKALKKMWFLSDLPGNANRIGVLHNQGYILDRDIYLIQMFIMKVDMRFADPVEGMGELHLRKLLFGCRNMVPLRDLLYGRITLLHLLQRVVWYQYSPSPTIRALNLPIFGIRANQIGRGNTEQWGRGTQRLLRVDEGIMREAIRRELNTHKYFMEFLVFGCLEQGLRQGKMSGMVRMKDVKTDFAKGRRERLEPFAFYRNAKVMQVPSEESNTAIVDNVEELRGDGEMDV